MIMLELRKLVHMAQGMTRAVRRETVHSENQLYITQCPFSMHQGSPLTYIAHIRQTYLINYVCDNNVLLNMEFCKGNTLCCASRVQLEDCFNPLFNLR